MTLATTRKEAMSESDIPYEPVLAPESLGRRSLSFGARVAITAVMPLFLMTTFVLCFVSAGHNPTPHDLSLVLAGPAQQTGAIADRIVDETDEAAFDLTETTSLADARSAVEDRSAAGAIGIGTTQITTVVASAAGATQAAIVRQVGAQIGAALSLPVTVDDVAPTIPSDAGGTSVFFFLIVCTLGSYLTVTVLSQTAPDAGVLAEVASVAGAAVLSPIIGFSIISTFVGDYGVPFGSIAAVLAIGMLYSFAIGMISVLFTRLAGLGGTLIAMVFLIAVNFPSSGGSTAAGVLPPFWQVVHSGWIGSGMLESVRGILYFEGAQVDRWMGQLWIWAIAGTVLALAFALFKDYRKRPRPAGRTADPQVHVLEVQEPAASAATARKALTPTPLPADNP